MTGVTQGGDVAEPGAVGHGRRPAPGSARRVVRAIVALRRRTYIFALALTIVLLTLLAIRSPNVNWTSLIAAFAPVAIAALASTPAIVSGGGGFDVSVSPTMILTTAVFGVVLVPAGLNSAASLPVLLALGAVVGLVNGFLIIRLRVQPVVVTLATSFVVTGINILLVPAPLFISSVWVADFAGPQADWPGAALLVALPIAIWAALGRTSYLRALHGVGSSDVAAFSSGIDVARVRIGAYVLCGMFASVGGLAILATTQSVNAGLSGTYTVTAVAAVALGGTSLWGGNGGLFGSLLGAASIYLIGALLITMNVDPAWLRVVSGGMLLLAVVIVGIAYSRTARGRRA